MATVNTAWDHVGSNVFKTWLIMFLFSLFTVVIVYIFARGFGYGEVGGLGMVGFALIMAGMMNFVSYFWSDKIVLGISGAKPISESSHKELYRTVENLTIAAGLPMPKIYLIDDSAPNAFATGRDPEHAVICVTSGLLEKLDKLELEGVISNELSHVKNFDTRLMGIVAILVGSVAFLSDWFMRSLWWGNHGSREERGNQGIFLVIGIVL